MHSLAQYFWLAALDHVANPFKMLNSLVLASLRTLHIENLCSILRECLIYYFYLIATVIRFLVRVTQIRQD